MIPFKNLSRGSRFHPLLAPKFQAIRCEGKSTFLVSESSQQIGWTQ